MTQVGLDAPIPSSLAVVVRTLVFDGSLQMVLDSLDISLSIEEHPEWGLSL